jgi:hypothetical protein
MKAACGRLYRQLLCDDISAQMTKHLAVQFSVRAWKMASPHVLEQAPSACFDEDEICWVNDVNNPIDRFLPVEQILQTKFSDQKSAAGTKGR